MKAVFKTLDLSDENEIFRVYTTMVELYNALKFIPMLYIIQKIVRFNLGVAFLKSVSIYMFLKSKIKIIKLRIPFSFQNLCEQLNARIQWGNCGFGLPILDFKLCNFVC